MADSFQEIPSIMELLTDRLCFVMKEMGDNLMSELISKHHSECLKIVQNEDEATAICNNKKKIKGNEDKYQHFRHEAERQNKLAALNSIWGASKHLKDKTKNGRKEEANKKPRSKFLKAAKILVVINVLKQGVNVCTCNSLESKCKRHDS